MLSKGTPLFDGQPVFGDPKQFSVAIFNGNALDEDAWLGLTPGTTVYGPCQPPNGGAIAIKGVLLGATTEDVQQVQANLAGFADGNACEAILPTGLSAWGWDQWASCWFAPTDLAWGSSGIVTNSFPGYQVSYSLILHRQGGLKT